MTSIAIGLVACIAWTYLLVARGGFWRERPRDDTPASTIDAWPSVVAIVPARDEADVIGGSLSSLLRQVYAGAFSVIVVDDASTDATVSHAYEVARASDAAERVRVVAASPTPPGWTGKLWALHCGIEQAKNLPNPPEYLLLTDADIVHDARTLRELVARARADRLVLVSMMAKLRCASAVERAFVPAFVFFFQMLYPFAWVNRPERHTAAAAGGCMLVHRAALERAGGVAAVRGALIDDCALARALKVHGPIRLSLTERVQSIRAYDSIADIRRMVVRSAYAQLRFSPLLLALTLLGMAIVYIAPPVLAIAASGAARVLGAIAWIQMTLAFQPTVRFYRVSPLWGVALPAIAAAYLVFTLDSAYQAARGRAGLWKGRMYPKRSS